MFQDVSKLLSGEKSSIDFTSEITEEKALEMGFGDIFYDTAFSFPIKIEGKIGRTRHLSKRRRSIGGGSGFRTVCKGEV